MAFSCVVPSRSGKHFGATYFLYTSLEVLFSQLRHKNLNEDTLDNLFIFNKESVFSLFVSNDLFFGLVAVSYCLIMLISGLIMFMESLIILKFGSNG
jgi:hypothetical protein